MLSAAANSDGLRGGEAKLIRKGVTWNAAGMLVSKSTSILAKLILARLLVPEYFGFVSMVLVFTQMMKIGVDLGLKNTLIHRKRDRDSRLREDSAFWFLLFVASVTMAAMLLLGVPLIVWFYGVPELSQIGAAMSVSLLFHNLQVIPEVRLARAMRFKRIAMSEFFGTFVGCASAVTLAVLGAGVWSLVAQIVVGGACTAAALFFAAGWLPHLRFVPSLLRELKSYSSYLVGSRALTHLQQNLDYLLLGKLMGAHALGIYAIAFLVTETLRAQIYWLVARVVFPSFSRLIGNPAKIKSVYLGTVRYMSMAMFPLAMLLILFADDVVPALFGEVWVGAVQPIRILAVASMIIASGGTPGEVLRGVGKPKVDFGINLKVSLFVAFPALWIGIELLGLPGAALAVLLHYAVSRLLFQIAIRREIALTAAETFSAIRPALIGSYLMLLCDLALADSHWSVAALLSLVAYCLATAPTILSHFKGKLPGRSGRIVDVIAGSAGPCTFIVFLGPDGAGKTTLAQSLEGMVRSGSRRLYLGMGLDEQWALPWVRALYSFHLTRNRWTRKVTGFLIWYVLFPLEIVARRAIGASRGPSRLVLIDRLPGRPFTQGGALLACYRCLIPGPLSAVVLIGNAAAIAKRKPEETNAQRTKTEMKKWEVVARQTGATTIIRVDTTRNGIRACTQLLIANLAPGITPTSAAA